MECEQVQDMEQFGSSRLPSKEGCHNMVLGLVVVKYQGPWEGPLTQMDDERRAMSHLFGGSLPDMRFFAVLKSARLDPPLTMVSEWRSPITQSLP